jgi:superfamily II DNA or RNA helicase
LAGRIQTLFTLHGRMTRKQRTALINDLDALPPDAPRVLLSTGKLVGEGLDHAPLDTLVLAMPISWKGTLAQYAGRLHREHANKNSVRIIDFVDEGDPALLRMWERRRRGYQAMGLPDTRCPTWRRPGFRRSTAQGGGMTNGQEQTGHIYYDCIYIWSRPWPTRPQSCL